MKLYQTFLSPFPTRVRLVLYGHVEGRVRLENVNPAPELVTLQFSAQFNATLPGQPSTTFAAPSLSNAVTLATFDGIKP